MNLTGYKTAASDDDKVTFPLLESWNPMTKVATVAAQMSGKRILCRISLDVLKKKFRASPEEPMKAVAKNRTAIQAAARELIESKSFEPDGSIVIRQKDLGPAPKPAAPRKKK
ncbi:MAG: DUF1488 domain-containing protein [Gammaproteobacteria bacterium]|nr:DUF1488 domain-containing protein [Gammaproteobacteria bacterium]